MTPLPLSYSPYLLAHQHRQRLRRAVGIHRARPQGRGQRALPATRRRGRHDPRAATGPGGRGYYPLAEATAPYAVADPPEEESATPAIVYCLRAVFLFECSHDCVWSVWYIVRKVRRGPLAPPPATITSPPTRRAARRRVCRVSSGDHQRHAPRHERDLPNFSHDANASSATQGVCQAQVAGHRHDVQLPQHRQR